MRNITKTNEKEIKMKTTFIKGNTLDIEIKDFQATSSIDWSKNKTTFTFDEGDEVDEFIETYEKDYEIEELRTAYEETN